MLKNANIKKIALEALGDIAVFGKRNSGYGYSCAKKAQGAIDEINSATVIEIPVKMGNEESKLMASIINRQREKAIADANLFMAINKYNKFKEQ